MRFHRLLTLGLLCSLTIICADSASSNASEALQTKRSVSGKILLKTFDEAQVLFEKDKEKPEFQKYLGGFADWNNANKLDTRGDCYRLGLETVTLFLVIGSSGIIEQVLTELESPKAACFVKSYLGQQWKKPPYSPILMRMAFE